MKKWGLFAQFLSMGAFLMVSTLTAPAAEDQLSEITLDDGEEVAVLHTTAGDLVLQFYPDVAPGHVKNMKDLINKKYYDGIKFHRVIPGFMIQGGCPLTKEEGNEARWGTGGPGYTIKAEFNDKKHVRGTLSMARTMDPNSAGSQFFICHARAPHLDKQYTVFGQLVYGYKALDKIATAKKGANDRPLEPVEIKKAELMKWGDCKAKLSETKTEE